MPFRSGLRRAHISVMDADPGAIELARRAASLRALAERLRAADLTRLARLAGDATWYGPTAGAFLLDCTTVVRLTAGAAGELARAAAHLEATAAAVSAAAAASRLAVGASTAAPRPAGAILRS